MTVKISVKDGPALFVDEPLDRVKRAYEEALSKNKPLAIVGEDGDERHLVNPASVALIQKMDDE